jgi:hypothetical protein
MNMEVSINMSLSHLFWIHVIEPIMEHHSKTACKKADYLTMHESVVTMAPRQC